MVNYTTNSGSSIRHYVCKSTDIKPTGGDVPNGSDLYEMDTGDIYMYDAETKTWLKQ